MKKLLFSLSFLFASAIVFAAPRSLQQMKEAAKNVLKTAVPMTRSVQTQLEVLKKGGQYTVIGYATGGFAVIADDDKFNAVIGYSDRQFSTETLPPAMLWWIDAADEAMRLRLESGTTAIVSATPAGMGYPEAVEPLMVTAWDQGTPYNNKIVEASRGVQYPTGCVATAMAQIMKYHNWPDHGTGFKNHRCTPEGATTALRLSADFENTTYDWGNMLPEYNNGGYTDEQADAVAELMLHCGVAVEMEYGLSGSGAYDNMAATALKQYFRYSTKLYTRDIYTTQDWMGIIYDEISNSRPVFYGGATAQRAGHAFVFDGYDADGLVHVNWGWSGSGDGYYDMAILDSPTGSYSYHQDMIALHTESQPEIPYSSQWGLLDWPLSGVEGSFTITVEGTQLTYQAIDLFQMDAEPFTGQLALLAYHMGGGSMTVLDSWSATSPTGGGVEHAGGYRSLGETVSIASLPDGTYRVYLASKATTETEWQPVRSNETIVNNYIITKWGTSVSVEEGEPGWTTGIESVTVTGAEGDGLVRVYTADGVLVYTSPAATFSLDGVPASGLLIVKKGAETVKVVKK